MLCAIINEIEYFNLMGFKFQTRFFFHPSKNKHKKYGNYAFKIFVVFFFVQVEMVFVKRHFIKG